MRPIIKRLQNPDGDESLITYDQHVELFDFICLKETYPHFSPEEKENTWSMLRELAMLIGFTQLTDNAIFGPLTNKAVEVAKGMGVKPTSANKSQMFASVFNCLTDTPELITEMGSMIHTLVTQDQQDTSRYMLDLMESTGMVSFEQRARAEQKMEKKHNNDDDDTSSSVKMHVSGDKLSDPINDIVEQMMQAEKTKPTSIEELLGNMKTAEEETASLKEEIKSKGPQDLGSVLAGLAVNVPIDKDDNKRLSDTTQILSVLTSKTPENQNLKEKMKHAGKQLIDGDIKSMLANMQSIITDLKPGEPVPDLSLGSTGLLTTSIMDQFKRGQMDGPSFDA